MEWFEVPKFKEFGVLNPTKLCWVHKKTGKCVCVNGLQQTTAFIKLVEGEIKAFNQTFDEFGLTKREAGIIQLPEYAVSVYQNGLSERKSVLEWYIEINEGETLRKCRNREDKKYGQGKR